MTVLVSGGAGFIGAHVVRALLGSGRDVAVLDDLSTGKADVVPAGVPLHVASVSEVDAVARVLADHVVRGVVHLAALKSVEESEREPSRYFRENVGGMATLLMACREAAVEWFLLSSTAAVYGTPDTDLVTESAPTRPESAYGESKLVCEWMLRREAAATGLRWAALRYFNVVGAAEPALGDRGRANLFPRVLESVDRGEPPVVFGTDYPTPDGTCVRDYIDVADVADAHVVTAAALEAGASAAVYNVGTGRGVSVRGVVDAFAAVTGRVLEPKVLGRRPGDPATVVADPSRIRRDLGWNARYTVEHSVRAAWEAWRWQDDAPPSADSWRVPPALSARRGPSPARSAHDSLPVHPKTPLPP